MNLLLRALRYHLQMHWSNQANFWSGVLGMIVNNALVLLGVWAMLFAGKAGLDDSRDQFFLMNFMIMLSYGSVHVIFGGISQLDRQINEGGLDLALVTPRNPILMLSITSSHLPAWGDLLLGFLGLLFFALRGQPWILVQGMALAAFAALTMYSFLLLIGTLAFWFRRTEAAYSVLINVFLAVNTYPVLASGTSLRWRLFLVPALMAGSLPAELLLNPSPRLVALEVGGSLAFYLIARAAFASGLKRYQSVSGLSLQRT